MDRDIEENVVEENNPSKTFPVCLALEKMTSKLNKACNSEDVHHIHDTITQAADTLDANDTPDDEVQKSRRRLIGAMGKASKILQDCSYRYLRDGSRILYEIYYERQNGSAP